MPSEGEERESLVHTAYTCTNFSINLSIKMSVKEVSYLVCPCTVKFYGTSTRRATCTLLTVASISLWSSMEDGYGELAHHSLLETSHQHRHKCHSSVQISHIWELRLLDTSTKPSCCVDHCHRSLPVAFFTSQRSICFSFISRARIVSLAGALTIGIVQTSQVRIRENYLQCKFPYINEIFTIWIMMVTAHAHAVCTRPPSPPPQKAWRWGY